MDEPVTEYRIEIWPPIDPAERGGQHVGSGPSGVKVTHLPTGITATCEAGRSQHINRMIAMDMILSAVTHPMFGRLDCRPMGCGPCTCPDGACGAPC